MTNLSMPARWTMWENFSTTIAGLAKHDEQAAKDLLFGMWKYASWGEEPDFGDNYWLKGCFDGVRFNLDASVKSCMNGKKGGQAKAANAKKKEEDSRREADMNKEESKRLRKLTRSMGNLYEATVIPEYGDDDVLPDWEYESQAAYMDAEYERKREMLQAEIDAECWIGGRDA